MTLYEDVRADAYHADILTDRPTLSSSIANVLIQQSPAHAAAAHPRLNTDFERTEEAKFDVGTACHALILQGDDIMAVVDAPDWRSNAAKAARDEFRAAGKVPLLPDQFERVEAMAVAVRRQISEHDAQPGLFVDGKPEQTIVWEDQGVACRARLDWLHDDHQAVDDLKSTGASAHPAAWQRTLYNIGADVQVAFYLRGVNAVLGTNLGPEDFRFVVVETSVPYALSVVSLAPSAFALANEKVDYALAAWKRGIESGIWPAYPQRVAHVEMPAWAESQWLSREEVAA